jgi:hypothetical protein
MVREEVAAVLTDDGCMGMVMDMFRTFVEPLETEFG